MKKSKKDEKKKIGRKEYQIKIIDDRCKGCRLCVLYCPTDTLEMSKNVNKLGNFIPVVKNIKTCKGCYLCFKFCPDFAIFCYEKNIDEGKNR